MFYQTFDSPDIAKVLTLTFLEIVLSADNAIVLSLLIRTLPETQRKKALWIGAISAIVLRAIALFSLAYLLRYSWIQALGGLYLLFISIRHFTHPHSSHSQPHPNAHFWKTIALIELFDLAFAVDSILAGFAFIDTAIWPNPKIWIVYVGGIMGVLTIRYAAVLFSSIIDRFPRMEAAAHLLIGWIGLKMLYLVSARSFDFSLPYEPLFWTGLAGLLLWGFSKRLERLR